MLRATTNGVLKGYRYNLYTSRYTMDKNRNTVLTQRNFNSYAEDPAAAAHCYQLRRAFQRANSQMSLGESVCRKYDVAWHTMESVLSDVNQRTSDSAMAETIRAENGPTAAGRQALGLSLENLADSIAQTMNAKYGENFVFAGADGLNVPFSWDLQSDPKKLLYRGIPVDTPEPPKLEMDAVNTQDPAKFDKDGNAWVDGTSTGEVHYKTVDGELVTQANYEKNVKDFEALSYMAKGETKYADLGLGLQEDENGKIIPGSAIDVSQQGIDFLDWGVDKDGDPKNVVSIIQRMAEILKKCDPDSGAYPNGTQDKAEMDRLLNKLNQAGDRLSNKHTALDTQKKFLDSNQLQLENSTYTIRQQFAAVEDVDMEAAITEFSWAKVCYNTALKVGNSILGQSLMDYINA